MKKMTLVLSLLLLTACGGISSVPSSSVIPSSLPSESSIVSSSSSDSSTEPSPDSSSVSASTSVPSSSTVISSALPSSSVTNPSSEYDFEPTNGYQWKISKALYGHDFMSTLGAEINATRTATATYSQCLSIGAKAAAYPNASSSTFIPFYHEAKDSEKTTTNLCNREHCWPNSRGGGSKGGGDNIEIDPLVIRPTLTKDNSDRGNDVYGSTAGTWDPASLGYEAARGESARVILYAMACYGDSNGLILNNDPTYSKGTKNMGILSTLLEWNRTYLPSEFEVTVASRYAAMGHARNAFVDHPEFADYIWTDDGYRTTPYEGSTPSQQSKLQQVKDISELDGLDAAIVSYPPSTPSSYVAMSNEHKTSAAGGDLPWYLVGASVSISDQTIRDSSSIKKFHLAKLESGYAITFGQEYLYSYIDGTHYSIQLGEPDVASKSKVWNIEMDESGKATVYGQIGESRVYLTYSDKASFCGSSSRVTGNIFFYSADN